MLYAPPLRTSVPWWSPVQEVPRPRPRLSTDPLLTVVMSLEMENLGSVTKRLDLLGGGLGGGDTAAKKILIE